MDGAPRMKEFPVHVIGDPNLTISVDRVDNYVPVWPCTHDYIHIQVCASIMCLSGRVQMIIYTYASIMCLSGPVHIIRYTGICYAWHEEIIRRKII